MLRLANVARESPAPSLWKATLYCWAAPLVVAFFGNLLMSPDKKQPPRKEPEFEAASND
ncbi:MAG: hypothetical protein ACU0DX_13520 [Roseovarius sp.]|uniref:hypothetical protein n=1 Tax=Roseovarius sp. TaxID=1486281 RepID=UPI00260CB1BC|nr:hypothetical protein [Roseovarius sp.]